MDIRLEEFLQRKLTSENYTVAKIAKDTDIPKSTVSDWSAGRLPSGKSAKYLLTLSRYFKVSLEELMFNVRSIEEDSKILMSTIFLDEGTEYKMTIEKRK